MRNTYVALPTLLALAAVGVVHGQMRPGQPQVLTPPRSATESSAEIVARFRSRYQTAGAPRVMLYWDTAFDAATQAERQDVDVTTTSDLTGDAEGTRTVHTHAARVVVGRHPNAHVLSRRTLARLRGVFTQRLLAAGMHLYDRAASIRFTAAERDRKGIDPKLIEADAVLARADIVLQVVPEPDDAAPLGAGFKVSATRTKSAADLLSFYTRAVPHLPDPEGHYVPTNRGFEWVAPAPPNATQVGNQLADEVLKTLGAALPVAPLKRRHRK